VGRKTQIPSLASPSFGPMLLYSKLHPTILNSYFLELTGLRERREVSESEKTGWES